MNEWCFAKLILDDMRWPLSGSALIQVVDLLIKTLSFLLLLQREETIAGQALTDGGTSELRVVFLLGEWLYILTVWLAICANSLGLSKRDFSQ